MGLFSQFPYTNFHQLNLDWLIKAIKNLEDNAVLSVNGQTGDVVLYKSENIVFPDVESATWRMVRIADGHTAGVMFQNGLMYVMYDNTAERVYTVDHPPTYPVTSVNGETGAVELYKTAGIKFPDVDDGYMNIRRQIDSQGTPAIVGVQVDKNKAQRINGTNRYDMYDSQNPPPYPVESVNGKTGVVMLAIPFEEPLTDSIWMASEASADHVAGIGRETVDGTVELYLDTSSGQDAQAYIHFVSGDEQYTFTKRLLTLDDIPSSAGVVSLNGLTGVVTLYGDTMPVTSGSVVTVQDEINRLDNDIAYVENGATATHNIAKGHFVNWNYTLYTALSNISIGDTLSLSNLDPVSNGGLNVLHDRIEAIPISTEINIDSSTLSPTLVFEDYSKHMIALVGTNMQTRTALIFVSCSSQHDVTYYPIYAGSDLSFNASQANKLTITRTGGSLQVLDFALSGHTITLL